MNVQFRERIEMHLLDFFINYLSESTFFRAIVQGIFIFTKKGSKLLFIKAAAILIAAGSIGLFFGLIFSHIIFTVL